MAVKLRLMRMGKKKQPTYRIVAADAARPSRRSVHRDRRLLRPPRRAVTDPHRQREGAALVAPRRHSPPSGCRSCSRRPAPGPSIACASRDGGRRRPTYDEGDPGEAAGDADAADLGPTAGRPTRRPRRATGRSRRWPTAVLRPHRLLDRRRPRGRRDRDDPAAGRQGAPGGPGGAQRLRPAHRPPGAGRRRRADAGRRGGRAGRSRRRGRVRRMTEPPAPPPGPVLEVGRVARAHGIRGAVVVDLVTDRHERVEPGQRAVDRRGRADRRRDPAVRPALAGRLRGHRRPQPRPSSSPAGCLRAVALDDPEELWVHDLVGSEVVEADGTRAGPGRRAAGQPGRRPPRARRRRPRPAHVRRRRGRAVGSSSTTRRPLRLGRGGRGGPGAARRSGRGARAAAHRRPHDLPRPVRATSSGLRPGARPSAGDSSTSGSTTCARATTDPHRSVDDAPFGGGAGMVLMAPPIFATVEAVRPARPLFLLGPAGRRFDQRRRPGAGLARRVLPALRSLRGRRRARPPPPGGRRAVDRRRGAGRR